MKKLVFKTITPLLLSVIGILVLGQGCGCGVEDTEDIIEVTCSFEGFTYVDSGTNTMININEPEIATEYFPNASNGPFGDSGFEISSFLGTDTFIFVTNVVSLNEIGNGRLTINNGTEVIVSVKCLKTGSDVGDEVFFEISATNIEAELCVTIDDVRL